MTGQKPDERIRTPMRWDAKPGPMPGSAALRPGKPLSDDPPGTNVAAESLRPELARCPLPHPRPLRDAHPALSHGDWTPIDSSDAGRPRVPPPGRRRVGPGRLEPRRPTGRRRCPEPRQAGPLCGRPSAKLLLGTGQVRPPVVTPTGGFDGYVPVGSSRGTRTSPSRWRPEMVGDSGPGTSTVDSMDEPRAARTGRRQIELAAALLIVVAGWESSA